MPCLIPKLLVEEINDLDTEKRLLIIILSLYSVKLVLMI